MALPIRPWPGDDTVRRPDPPSAWIRLVGGIDLATAPSLAGYADRLHGLFLRFIVVDLTAVTFVGSTFVKFLVRLRGDHPESELVLQSPPMVARIVLVSTGMDRQVVMSGHPVSPMGVPGPDDPAMMIVELNAGHAGRGTGAGAKPVGPGRWETIDWRQARVRSPAGPATAIMRADAGREPPAPKR